MIRLLKLEDDGEDEAREVAQARIQAASAALVRLEELAEEDWVRDDTAERVRGGYDFSRNRFLAWLDGGDDGSIEARSRDFQRLRRELLNAERAARRTSCAGAARSRTRWRAGSSATSTSRTRGWRSDERRRDQRRRTCACAAAAGSSCPALSLEVAAGTVTGLLGPSGSGKTTLMRAIVGVQIVESGAVDVARPARRARRRCARASAT